MDPKKLYQELSSRLSDIVGSKVEIKIFENSSSVQFTLEEFFQNYNPEDIQKGQCNLVLRFSMNDMAIAACQLRDMYNCDGIVVMTDLFVHQDFRKKGIGLLITKFGMDFSKYYGYGLLQGTDREDNLPQLKIFNKLNWKKGERFTNPKSKNPLIMWTINLNEYAG